MANYNSNNEITNSWSLLSFAKAKGKMQVGTFHSVDENGNPRAFKSCVFINPDEPTDKTFVGFSSKLGELTPDQVVDRKNDLQVVELTDNETLKKHYYLCNKGENAWQDVML